MQRKYEVMFILSPDVVGEDADKLTAGFEATITKGGGKLVGNEKLGTRKLAYTVRKRNEGNYNLFTIEADGALIAELERRLRVTEQVIKFITVRMDEEEKRIDKIRKLRAGKIKQSAQPSAAPAATIHAPAGGPAAPAAPAPPAAETVAEPTAETATA